MLVEAADKRAHKHPVLRGHDLEVGGEQVLRDVAEQRDARVGLLVEAVQGARQLHDLVGTERAHVERRESRAEGGEVRGAA